MRKPVETLAGLWDGTVDIYQEFVLIIDALNRQGIDYAVCGGISMAIHGLPRFTRDIDMLIRPEAWPGVKGCLAPLGYTLEGGPLRFEAGKRTERRLMRLSKAAGPDEDLFTVDFLFVSDALEGVWQDRDQYEWQGRRIQSVSRAGLMAMKALAGRPQDLADVSRLERGDGEGD